MDPIYVNFSLPEQRLGVLTVGQTVTADVDAFPNVTFDGRITAIEPRVDENTRNFNLQATFRNADGRLQPGLFARVHIALPKSDTFVVVPQTAVSYNPYGNSVYVVQEAAAGSPASPPEPTQGAETAPSKQAPTLVVTRRLIKTGPTRGDFVAVVEGLKPGERVATSGLLKLRNDAVVVVNNKVTPAADLQPAPPES
jgi:membrane fusion protein (multidrug efflux system)